MQCYTRSYFSLEIRNQNVIYEMEQWVFITCIRGQVIPLPIPLCGSHCTMSINKIHKPSQECWYDCAHRSWSINVFTITIDFSAIAVRGGTLAMT